MVIQSRGNDYFLIPLLGYGSRHYKPEGAPSDRNLFPTYWGQKESEDSPPYMGIMVLALAVIGLIFYRKDIFVQCLFVVIIFSVFLSFGKNMSLLYDFFYYNIPSFNKFRAPSMSLALMHFSVPILAGYGISAIIKFRNEVFDFSKKYVWGTFIASGAFLFLAIVFALIFQRFLYSGSYFKRYYFTLPSIFPKFAGLCIFKYDWRLVYWCFYFYCIFLFNVGLRSTENE